MAAVALVFVQRVGALVERAGASVVVVVVVVVAKVVVLEAGMVLVAVSRAGAVVVAAKMQCNVMTATAVMRTQEHTSRVKHI